MATDNSPLTYEYIKNICTEFINDSDTIIALENNWLDWMTQTIYVDGSKEEIMKALNVNTADKAVCIPVKFVYRGIEDDSEMYVAIYDNKIRISTLERLLYKDM